MLYKLTPTIFILFLSSHYVYAKTILVKDHNNNSVEFTYILNISNDNWSLSDHNGLAPVPHNTKLNDSLKIQRYGYKTYHMMYNKETTLIYLNPDPVLIGAVIVKSSKLTSGLNNKGVTKTTGHKNISHKEYLELLPGVQIKTLGGPGSISTVSLNGGPTSQTKVTLNGFNLSSMQTGVTDLSQLPTAFIDEARIVTSGQKLIGSGSQNGVLELSTWEPNNSFSHSTNSLNSKESYGKLALQSKLIQTSIIIGKRYDKGDFKVSWRDESFNRQNNNFNQSYGSFQFYGRINNNLFVKGLSLSTKQKRGVPGQVWSPSNASHEDDLKIYASSINWISNTGKGSLKYFHRLSNDSYKNPQYSSEDKNRLESSSLIISNPILRTKNAFLGLSVEAQRQLLKSDQKKYKKDILTTTLNFIFELNNSIIITPSIQNNFSDNFFNHTTYSFLSTYDFKNNVFNQLALSFSTHFRHPTFNDLYWQPGGNPNLKSETGKNHTLNLSLKPTFLGAFNIVYFNTETNNLIQWLPIQSYWQPKNLSEVKRYGFSGSWSKNTQYLQIRSSFSLTESYYGEERKPLRYSPKFLGTLFLEKKIRKYTFNLNTHYTEKMISMYSYPENNIIPANTITSFHTSKKYDLNGLEIIGRISILNILNKQYESSKGYPEPGRSVGLSITVNQKRK